jgi:hypothetical protein
VYGFQRGLALTAEHHKGPIEDGGTVDEVVRGSEHNYVAVIGGDIHNYQRYPVKVEGRDAPIYYIISGGGGVYMHATHKIPKIELDGVDESDFVCYPRRGDSLSFYSNLYDRRLGFGKGWFRILPDQAAAYMGERLRITPEREGDQKTYVSERTAGLPSGSFRCRVVDAVFCTTTSPSFLTGTILRSSRASCGSTLPGASCGSAASRRRAASNTRRTRRWRTTSGSSSALRVPDSAHRVSTLQARRGL